MEIVILAILIGLIPAAVASGKGHNFFLWWLFGAGLFIVALPCALLLKDPKKEAAEAARDAALAALVANTSASANAQSPAQGASERTRTCDWCAETIKADARICRFCDREVAPAAPAN
ncbi:MAG: hypothetical protein Q8R97_04125 [Brevundimonas sp.]|uniref:hypothetical protein n=1 Tax=Brevundimonas sp. TaxID=1871086 RepID=UPI00274C6CD5|nr:hypothetical protein [Brevundimonas sp.]MDP3400287.1 hypothetical protein [Brevundimonas sp.]MDZ4108418.1 hypothetical protein [Brevundimonas sp.]